jgi:hypothetical protein
MKSALNSNRIMANGKAPLFDLPEFFRGLMGKPVTPPPTAPAAQPPTPAPAAQPPGQPPHLSPPPSPFYDIFPTGREMPGMMNQSIPSPQQTAPEFQIPQSEWAQAAGRPSMRQLSGTSTNVIESPMQEQGNVQSALQQFMNQQNRSFTIPEIQAMIQQLMQMQGGQ